MAITFPTRLADAAFARWKNDRGEYQVVAMPLLGYLTWTAQGSGPPPGKPGAEWTWGDENGDPNCFAWTEERVDSPSGQREPGHARTLNGQVGIVLDAGSRIVEVWVDEASVTRSGDALTDMRSVPPGTSWVDGDLVVTDGSLL